MAECDKTAIDLLEGMALKIVMIEPGDLSIVGEILGELERLPANAKVAESPHLSGMVKLIQGVLEKIVMAELPDSTENYERIGECVGLMQRTVKNNGVAGEDIIENFCGILTDMGYEIKPEILHSQGGVRANEKSVASRRKHGAGEPTFLHDREMAEGFVEETSEHLEYIEKAILSLEKSGKDPDAVHALFRAFHTIKGIANCLELKDAAELTHAVENLLGEVRSGNIGMDSGIVDIVLRAADHLRGIVTVVKNTLENGAEHYERADIEGIVRLVETRLDKPQDKSVDCEAGNNQAPAGVGESISQPLMAPAAEVRGADEPNDLYHIDLNQDKDLIVGFIEESTEHLETIEVNLLELEQNPDDVDIINKIFRPFHTIKGVSGFLNFKAINKLAHTTENLLDDVRNGARPMTPEVIDVVLGVGDCLKSMIRNIREVLENGPECHNIIDINPWVRRITIIREGGEDTEQEEVAPEKAKEPGTLATQPHTDSPQKKTEVSLSVAARATPAMAKGVAEKPPASTEAKGSKTQKIDTTIKVSVDKLDGLVNAVGELVIMLSLVQENPSIRKINNPKLAKDFSQLTRITSELQKTAMSMRMVPISQTFQKMIRLVRDLSKKSGKKVELRMEGEETEIDRNMVDSIYDPLVHMIRNSVDHGVQTPEERVKQGKPETGTVHLRAYQRGGNMVIEIEDDGNGLNPLKIRTKAIERGLIRPDEEKSDHELNNLIFLPGFSTAEKITEVSGRGVGMDVVKKTVEKLRGKVEVVSEPGRGSTFIIRLPLTLAIIDGIVVRVGSERYIIPTIAIHESIKPQPEQYTTVHNRGEALLIRENLVPIIRLYEVFHVDNGLTDPNESIMVVVENEGTRRALMVDEVLGKQEVVIKNLGGLTDIKGVAGGTILGDGRVGLILDLAGLMSMGTESKIISPSQNAQ